MKYKNLCLLILCGIILTNVLVFGNKSVVYAINERENPDIQEVNPVIEISAFFPDETFSQYISNNYDNDEDGFLSDAEIASVTSISISDKAVTSLQGIDVFSSLETLDCSNCSLTELNLQDNLNLISINCSNNMITDLSLFSSSNKLQEIRCYGNKLEAASIYANWPLKKFYCWDNDFEKISYDENSNIQYIPSSEDEEDVLDYQSYVSWDSGIAYDEYNKYLVFVKCKDVNLDDILNYQFRSFARKYDLNKDGTLSASEISKVKSVSIDGSAIDNFSGLEIFCNLRNLSIQNSIAMDIRVENNYLLENVDISNNTIHGMVMLRNCFNLENVEVNNNKEISNLMLDNDNKLTSVKAINNSLQNLDIHYCTNMESLICFNNMISMIICPEAEKLETLYCWNNAFDVLEVRRYSFYLKYIPDTDEEYYDDYDEWGSTIERIDTDRLLFGETCNDPKIYLNDTVVFPDTNFRAFISQFDQDKNGRLSGKERATVTEMDVSNKNITSLKGIEFFKSIKNLNCSNNMITSLDLTALSALETLDCSHNELVEFSTGDILGISTSVKNLNLSYNKLEKFETPGWLSTNTIDLSHNYLKKLSMKGCFYTTLICNDNEMTELTDISPNVYSETYCFDNLLENLSFGSSLVKGVYAWNNSFKTIDLSSIGSLEYIPKDGTEAYKSYMEWGGSIQMDYASSVYTLTYVDLEYIPITKDYFPDAEFREILLNASIDKNTDSKLTKKEIEDVREIEIVGSFSSLEGIEQFQNLEKLKCSSPNLTSLDVSNNSKLTALICSGCSLETLDLVNNKDLTILECENNKLTDLNISKNVFLERLICKNNLINAISFGKNSGLAEIDCSNNQITELYNSELSGIKKLDCSNNNIENLSLSKNVMLEELICDNNSLAMLDISNCSKLVRLLCYDNQLSELNVNASAQMLVLYAWNNRFDKFKIKSDGSSIDTIYSRFVPTSENSLKPDKSDCSSYQNWGGAIEYLKSEQKIYFLSNISSPITANDIPGDVNRDGKLDDIDVAYTNAFIKGNLTPSDTDLAQCDVNGDGEITSEDKEFIEKKIDGIISGFPIEKVLDGLSIKKTPTKLEYYIGDTLDLSGMVVIAHYTNDETENVTDYNVICNLSTLGKKKVEVSYTEGNITRKAEFTVTVVKKNNPSDSDNPSGQDQPDTSTGNNKELPANPTTQPATTKPATQKTTDAKKKTVAKKAQKITAKNKFSLDLGKKNVSVGAKKTGNGKLKYKSLNPKIVKINSKGKMTAVGIGKATIVITATGTSKYKTATKRVVVTVGIAKQICKVKTMSNGYIRANWNKDKNADKYEVHFSNTKTFKKWWTKEFKKSETALNGRLGTKGTIYYMRVRSVKKVKGKTYYGAWSDVVKIILK